MSDIGDTLYAKSEKESKSDLIRERNKERLDKDIRHVLSIPEGRRVLWWIMKDVSGSFGISFDSKSERMTDFNEGKRLVGLVISNQVESVDINAIQQMRLEEYSRIMGEETELNKLDDGNEEE